MLAVLLAGALATQAPADTAVRVPGMPLRFGLPRAAVEARGFHAPAAGDPAERAGSCRFFGLDAEAVLTFEDDRLARARVEVKDAAGHQVSYVEDQLARLGYRRRCTERRPRQSVCDWLGKARVHLEVAGGQLKATVEPLPPSVRAAVVPPAVRDSAAGMVVADPVPVSPETLAVAEGPLQMRYANARVLERAPVDYPEAARKAGVQGRVRLLALVGPAGDVLEAHVLRGIPELDAAALDAVRRWRFEPRTWQGRPCRYRVVIPVTFRLY
ncbi:MAG: energy transducer TonB [Candidatus Eisenbacteria bacterium]|nr:energy transducer TonB [Candidatus Eisenbacteria bacterium]